MTTSPGNDSRLTDLPNVGREVAKLLTAAGIRTPSDLSRLGSVAAALRIRDLRPKDPPCRSMLAGLEGAIRGVRWHAIPKAERETLWNEFRIRADRSTTRRVPRPS
jgi:DNA transformation protein and related proteins